MAAAWWIDLCATSSWGSGGLGTLSCACRPAIASSSSVRRARALPTVRRRLARLRRGNGPPRGVLRQARDRGFRADALIKDVAEAAGGRGGGKPHMAQAGIPDANALPRAYAALGSAVRQRLAGSE